MDARSQQGVWLVRMEDVDLTRNVPGAADNILSTLDAFGFEWSGSVLWQSTRTEAYAEALMRLQVSEMAYACRCSRKEIADAAVLPAIDGGVVYPGTCRQGMAAGRAECAWRLRVTDEESVFEDRLQGLVGQNLAHDVGDFVLRRADGLFAYQLAVTVDDEFQGISEIVRGADLLASTPRQIWLQRCLGFSTPRYAHLPVASNAAGEKLSKQTLAPALDARHACELLVNALHFLGQPIPLALCRARVVDVWIWADENWSFSAIPKQRSIRLD